MGNLTSAINSPREQSSYQKQNKSFPLNKQKSIEKLKAGIEKRLSSKKCVFVYIHPKDKLETITVGNDSQDDLEVNQIHNKSQEEKITKEENASKKEKSIRSIKTSNDLNEILQKRQTKKKIEENIEKENVNNFQENMKESRTNSKDEKKRQNSKGAARMQSEKEGEERGQLGKVLVQWNTFIKVKKKNYLEDYTHVKEIGKGAFGTVSKIKMKYGGMFRAAKIIKGAAFDKKLKDRQKFINEIVIPMKLDHPNLNKLFEVFQWKNQFVLIMQLCEGGDLFNKIKKGGIFTEKKVAEMMKQILSAVVYLHRNNIVHRDLKPENMLYDTQSHSLKLIDFGTAIERKQNTKKLTSLVGTPYYIAPEVVKGSYDQKCDVWSCGVILYLLLCGMPPFVGHNEKDIMKKIVSDRIEFKDNIWKRRSKNSQELVIKMLNKNPEQRITAMEALNSEWMNNADENQELTDVGNEVMKNLQGFHFQNKLKAVVYTYIASQLYSNKDKEKLLKAFRQMDKDGDGVLGKEELVQVFKNYNGCSFTEDQIQKIINLVDTNGSGLIDFTQFLVAASNQEELLQKQRLENAFSYLDTDHSGYITPEEVKEFLDDTHETSEEIRKIFQEVDQNGDGQISKQEFISLLLKKN